MEKSSITFAETVLRAIPERTIGATRSLAQRGGSTDKDVGAATASPRNREFAASAQVDAPLAESIHTPQTSSLQWVRLTSEPRVDASQQKARQTRFRRCANEKPGSCKRGSRFETLFFKTTLVETHGPIKIPSTNSWPKPCSEPSQNGR